LFLRGESLGDQESVGRDAQRRVMVEAAPASPLEVTKADLLLEFVVVALNAPAQLGNIDELTEANIRRKR